MISYDLIRFWTSISPSLSPKPLIFQVTMRILWNTSVTGAMSWEARLWVSCFATYLSQGLDCPIISLAAFANASFPESEKWRPSLPKCDRNRWLRFIGCSLLDLVHKCLIKMLTFSIFSFSETSSNLIGILLNMIWADLFRLSTSLTRSPNFVMHVATSSVGILLVPPSNIMTSSRFETIPLRRLCIPSALAPGQGKQHATMPRFLSVSRSPWPLTIDAPMIFTLHPRFGAFFCISVSPFCEHFSRLLAFVCVCLSSVHSLARGAKALRVSTFIITLSSPFLLSGTRFFTFLFNFLICLLFLTTFPFTDSVNFSSVAVDFDNSSRITNDRTYHIGSHSYHCFGSSDAYLNAAWYGNRNNRQHAWQSDGNPKVTNNLVYINQPDGMRSPKYVNKHCYWHADICCDVQRHIVEEIAYVAVITLPFRSLHCIYQLLQNKANLKDLIAATDLVILLKFKFKSPIFPLCDLEIRWISPKNNKARLLYYIKLCVSFQIHQLIQTGVTVRKRPIWVKFDDYF